MPLLIGFISGVIVGALVTTLIFLGRSAGRGSEARAAGETQVDSVTGLATHERLVTDLKRELEGGNEVTLYLFSLDGFKDYNDAYGDVCGDVLLGWLGRKLRDAVGSYGGAYRMRGGSFALLAVGSERFTNSLCASAASALSESGDGFQISCDVGSASLPREAGHPREALELAARRASKAAGERHVKSGRRAPSDAIEALRLVRSRQDVAALAVAIARRMDVPEAEIEQVENAVHLCDVGNVAVPRAVLSYPGKITGPEWQFILLHTLVGARLISGPLGLEPVAGLVRHSHERWDGEGYPDGLAGETIPLGSRIVFVCSAFHDMTSDRPHHQALEPDDALAQLERGAGSQFDPAVVAAFRAEFAGEADEPAVEDEAEAAVEA